MSDYLLYKDDELWNSITVKVTLIDNNKVPYQKIREMNNYSNNNTLPNNKYDYIPKIKANPNNTHNISNGLNLDSNTKKKVDKGKYKIDAILDLHGYTLNAAYDTLIDFITKNYNLANKCLLVITGLGNTNRYNSIKSNLGKWLQNEQIANIILYYKEAIHIHGGNGAFYVLLKSKNKKI